MTAALNFGLDEPAGEDTIFFDETAKTLFTIFETSLYIIRSIVVQPAKYMVDRYYCTTTMELMSAVRTIFAPSS